MSPRHTAVLDHGAGDGAPAAPGSGWSVESAGCWLWDHFWLLAIAATGTSLAMTSFVHRAGAWGAVAFVPGAGLLVSLLVGRWANERRRDRRCARRLLVIELSDETHDELLALAGEAGCSVSELLRRAVALHQFVWQYRDDGPFALADEPIIQRALGRPGES